MKALELFAGAGGLALGTTLAGFEHLGVVELNQNACATIRENNARGVISWPLHQRSVKDVDFTEFGSPDLVAGGPPCQPFSIGGKHRGQSDDRNLFPEAIRAIRQTMPKAVLVENVKGLLRPAFSKFLEHVLLQITYPEIVSRVNESWIDHLNRLERHHTMSRIRGLTYRVVFRKLNSADYGVPQKRERVFIVAFRHDVDAKWSFPDPTHSEEELFRDQCVTGEYWKRHGVTNSARSMNPVVMRRKADLVQQRFNVVAMKPWRTVRDAIADLPNPKGPNGFFNHRVNAGAKSYPGHTGSPLDEPAKTLKAGDHGVPGGENMLLHPNGKVRYFTVRESARLQTFPDDYVFEGSWTESMRQLGNAVPVELGKVIAASIAKTLENGR